MEQSLNIPPLKNPTQWEQMGKTSKKHRKPTNCVRSQCDTKNPVKKCCYQKQTHRCTLKCPLYLQMYTEMFSILMYQSEWHQQWELAIYMNKTVKSEYNINITENAIFPNWQGNISRLSQY